MKTLFSVLALAATLSTSSDAAAQGTTPPQSAPITYVEPPDHLYVDLIVSTTAWARGSISKSLGVLQRDDAPPVWRRAIEAATQRYGLRLIEVRDYVAVCLTRAASRSASSSRSCSMKGADAVLQFTSVLITGDSGFVGTSVTRVPRSELKAQTANYCVSLTRKGAGWELARSDTAFDATHCPHG